MKLNQLLIGSTMKTDATEKEMDFMFKLFSVFCENSIYKCVTWIEEVHINLVTFSREKKNALFSLFNRSIENSSFLFYSRFSSDASI